MALAGFGSGHLAELSLIQWTSVLLWNGWSRFNPCPPFFIPAWSSMWLHNEPDYGLSILFPQPQINSLICISPRTRNCNYGLRKQMGSHRKSRDKDRSTCARFTSLNMGEHPLKTCLYSFSLSVSQNLVAHVW